MNPRFSTDKIILSIPVMIFLISGMLNSRSFSASKILNNIKGVQMTVNSSLDTVTFGAGCFWCVEAIFQRVDGVKSVVSGYSGGTDKTPTYEEVCSGSTGHAEVIQIEYDPEKVTYEELLEIFWNTHDPTTLNQQGADRGTQYRSAIFYHNDEQKALALKYRKKLDDAEIFSNPIVTEIVPFEAFYSAENYHQNYYNQNANQPYCSAVITPKLEKFKKVFQEKLKTD